MKAVIIEDEKAAIRNLKAQLHEIAPSLEIVAELDSIVETIEWFNANSEPDLLFLDIHLADGSAFEIFEHIQIGCSIIFTTAYDEYALKAFRVNSIDYLLKPICESDLVRAWEKFNRLHQTTANISPTNMQQLILELQQASHYKTHFLVPLKGDKLIPLSAEDVLFFYILDGSVKAVVAEGREYVLPQTLDELTACLHPKLFFRANRQFLIARKAIVDMSLWFNGRLVVNLKLPTCEKLIISKARVGEFKRWFMEG